MKLGIYDVFDFNWWQEEAEILFCKEAHGFCEDILRVVGDADPSVDNLDRFAEFQADWPAGSSIEDSIYFL